jgi:plasmid maintenance system antidote protein VapI
MNLQTHYDLETANEKLSDMIMKAVHPFNAA